MDEFGLDSWLGLFDAMLLELLWIVSSTDRGERDSLIPSDSTRGDREFIHAELETFEKSIACVSSLLVSLFVGSSYTL